ncbi:MAG: hypothetical protein LBB16_02635 [Puniceicoccales bacterium]|jgi:phage-related protein|nr:hypothetical protein [Puniceicoccales bacterium]
MSTLCINPDNPDLTSVLPGESYLALAEVQPEIPAQLDRSKLVQINLESRECQCKVCGHWKVTVLALMITSIVFIPAWQWIYALIVTVVAGMSFHYFLAKYADPDKNSDNSDAQGILEILKNLSPTQQQEAIWSICFDANGITNDTTKAANMAGQLRRVQAIAKSEGQNTPDQEENLQKVINAIDELIIRDLDAKERIASPASVNLAKCKGSEDILWTLVSLSPEQQREIILESCLIGDGTQQNRITNMAGRLRKVQAMAMVEMERRDYPSAAKDAFRAVIDTINDVIVCDTDDLEKVDLFANKLAQYRDADNIQGILNILVNLPKNEQRVAIIESCLIGKCFQRTNAINMAGRLREVQATAAAAVKRGNYPPAAKDAFRAVISAIDGAIVHDDDDLEKVNLPHTNNLAQYRDANNIREILNILVKFPEKVQREAIIESCWIGKCSLQTNAINMAGQLRKVQAVAMVEMERRDYLSAAKDALRAVISAIDGAIVHDANGLEEVISPLVPLAQCRDANNIQEILNALTSLPPIAQRKAIIELHWIGNGTQPKKDEDMVRQLREVRVMAELKLINSVEKKEKEQFQKTIDTINWFIQARDTNGQSVDDLYLNLLAQYRDNNDVWGMCTILNLLPLEKRSSALEKSCEIGKSDQQTNRSNMERLRHQIDALMGQMYQLEQTQDHDNSEVREKPQIFDNLDERALDNYMCNLPEGESIQVGALPMPQISFAVPADQNLPVNRMSEKEMADKGQETTQYLKHFRSQTGIDVSQYGRTIVNMSGEENLCGYRAILSQIDQTCDGIALANQAQGGTVSMTKETLEKVSQLRLAIAIGRANGLSNDNDKWKRKGGLKRYLGKKMDILSGRTDVPNNEDTAGGMLGAEDVRHLSTALGRSIVVVEDNQNNLKMQKVFLQRVQQHIQRLSLVEKVTDLKAQEQALQKSIEEIKKGGASFRIYTADGIDTYNAILTDDSAEGDGGTLQANEKQRILGENLKDPNTIVLFNVNGNHYRAVQRRQH